MLLVTVKSSSSFCNRSTISGGMSPKAGVDAILVAMGGSPRSGRIVAEDTVRWRPPELEDMVVRKMRATSVGVERLCVQPRQKCAATARRCRLQHTFR